LMKSVAMALPCSTGALERQTKPFMVG